MKVETLIKLLSQIEDKEIEAAVIDEEGVQPVSTVFGLTARSEKEYVILVSNKNKKFIPKRLLKEH